MDLDEIVDELYGLPPEQFVAARNRLAKAVRDRGASRPAIDALRKPTVAAWLANQLVRGDPDGIHALAELGEQLRETYLGADGAGGANSPGGATTWSATRLAPRAAAAGGRRVTGRPRSG